MEIEAGCSSGSSSRLIVEVLGVILKGIILEKATVQNNDCMVGVTGPRCYYYHHHHCYDYYNCRYFYDCYC